MDNKMYKVVDAKVNKKLIGDELRLKTIEHERPFREKKTGGRSGPSRTPTPRTADILAEILATLKEHGTAISNIQADISGLKTDVSGLKTQLNNVITLNNLKH